MHPEIATVTSKFCFSILISARLCLPNFTPPARVLTPLIHFCWTQKHYCMWKRWAPQASTKLSFQERWSMESADGPILNWPITNLSSQITLQMRRECSSPRYTSARHFNRRELRALLLNVHSFFGREPLNLLKVPPMKFVKYPWVILTKKLSTTLKLPHRTILALHMQMRKALRARQVRPPVCLSACSFPPATLPM